MQFVVYLVYWIGSSFSMWELENGLYLALWLLSPYLVKGWCEVVLLKDEMVGQITLLSLLCYWTLSIYLSISSKKTIGLERTARGETYHLNQDGNLRGLHWSQKNHQKIIVIGQIIGSGKIVSFTWIESIISSIHFPNIGIESHWIDELLT